MTTSHISRCAFHKKDNKKYQQHCDDDTEITAIDLVNDDCLAEIFTYLPVCERPKIVWVCKNWKQALDYSWQNVKKLELTHWEYDEFPSYLIEYPTLNGHLKFLRSLLHKCGRYLTELDLTAYGHCNIVPVINKYCPNLEKLRLRFKYIEQKVLVNAFSRLSKLKVLKIIIQHIKHSEYIPVNLINSLRSVASTLTELTLSNWNDNVVSQSLRIPKTFIHILPELKALKSIETYGMLVEADFHMHLEQFNILFINHDYKWFKDNIDNSFLYKDITELSLKECQITDDCLYSVANCMKKLRTLIARCKWVTDAGIVALSKINSLKYLEFFGPCPALTDSSVQLLKNLEYLRLPFNNKMTDFSVTKILENSPEIKKFLVLESALTEKFMKKAAEITTNRETILELSLLYRPDLQQYESKYLRLVLFNSSNQCVYESPNSESE